MDYLNWYLNFAANNIYGFIPIIGTIYGFFFILKKVFKKLPNPLIFAGLSFFICIFTIPSIPRYNFENNVLLKYKNAGEFKLVNSSKWGALVEPVTLFKTPIGFFHYVSPVTHSSWKNFNENEEREFRSHIYRYSEPTRTQIINVHCSDMLISISEPIGGVYKYLVFNEKMNDNQKKIYCKTNFQNETNIFICKYRILSKITKPTEKEVINADNQCKLN